MADTALLIIDVQVGVVEGDIRAARLDSVLDKLNLAIAKARQRGIPVIFIQHEGGDLPHGSDAWQLHPKLDRQAGDEVVSKRFNDSFCDTNLTAALTAHEASKLWIGGALTDFCVDSTLRNAISRGFQVTVIADGHTTISAFTLSAEQVVDHFNAAWSHTSATPKPLLVLPAAEL
ncbi:cysteine hydrolase family protein [Chromobacterium sp. IIBBL 290-4]|uniref:cysteine hydrolase family protein n=1 Tax=Chromobacterium sp. IIBBL 290-4 TaxID=2953890 RepID=UPI0020B87EA9|nr:cysteine hydrolase family protein [Chromobacterium sp. IIBBL 290-4]UTH75460.1 cysteine hydrolase [Chromobacterium sp. IIBBL 290-4]